MHSDLPFTRNTGNSIRKGHTYRSHSTPITTTVGRKKEACHICNDRLPTNYCPHFSFSIVRFYTHQMHKFTWRSREYYYNQRGDVIVGELHNAKQLDDNKKCSQCVHYSHKGAFHSNCPPIVHISHRRMLLSIYAGRRIAINKRRWKEVRGENVDQQKYNKTGM